MQNSAPVFIITIDTEGDNLWANPQTVTTENAHFLRRFQSLCEDYGFKPTYLVNYEMALDETFQSFGREVLATNTAEIGLHVHPWNSPPIDESHAQHQPYLTELSDVMLEDKIDYLHNLLKQTFGVDPVSHRAGRWGFDERVAQALVQRGYLVDCSVTPGVSWKHYKGLPGGQGGSDYATFPNSPYLMDLDDLKHEDGQSRLLQVPMTIRPRFNPAVLKIYDAIKDARMRYGVERVFGPAHYWLRPTGRNLSQMIYLVDRVIEEGAPVLEFMLHSSELMPGGSPLFSTEAQIDNLYNHLPILFEHITSKGSVGMTLAEYRRFWGSQCVS